MMSYLPLDSAEQLKDNGPLFTTNQIIQVKTPQNTIYYIPVFIRLNIKNLVALQVEQLNASIHAILLVRFGLEKFQQYILKTSNKQRYKHLYKQLTTKVILKFSKNDGIILLNTQDNPSVTLKQQKGYIQFRINQSFDLDIFPQYFWLSPFQLLKLSFYVEIDSLETEFNGISFKLAFNCMDCSYLPAQREKVKDSITRFIQKISDQVNLFKKVTSLQQLKEKKIKININNINNELKKEQKNISSIRNGLNQILQASDYATNIQEQKQKIRDKLAQNAKNSYQTLKIIYEYQDFLKQLIQNFKLHSEQKFEYIKMSYNIRNCFGPYHMAAKMNNVSYSNSPQAFQFRNDQIIYKNLNRKKQQLPKIYFEINSQQSRISLQQLLRQQQVTYNSKQDANQQNLVPQKKQSAMKPQNAINQFQSFKYAIFSTYLYKQPISDIAVIFFPLWLQGLINTATFFIADSISDRLGILSAIIIAFVALVPTVREKLPPTDQITLIEIIIYLFTATALLLLLQTFYIHNNDQFKLNPLNDSLTQIMLGFSIAINIVTILIVGLLYLAFIVIWKDSYIYQDQTIKGQKLAYNKKNRKSKKKERKLNKSMELWSGGYCDQQFYQHIKKTKKKSLHKRERELRQNKDSINQQSTEVVFTFIQQKFEI